MLIKYQDKLLNVVNNFTLSNLYHTILLSGAKGSGKHLVCQLISENCNIPMKDITDNLNVDTINDIYVSVQPTLYIIDSDQISTKEQNIILKFLEEPCKSAYIILLNSNNLLLDTIKNRCYKLTMGKYNKEQLKTFISYENDVNSILFEIAETPGQVVDYICQDFHRMLEFSNKVFSAIKTANLSNCLLISDRLNFTKEKDETKFDVDLFCKILQYQSQKLSFPVYILTNQLVNDLLIPHINKKQLFEKYLVELKYLI